MISERETNRSVRFPVIRMRQPIGEFYIGKIEARPLTELTFVDRRGIFREREFETYLGIQRRLDPKRVSELVKYVGTIDATFPTGIILAVEERAASVEFTQSPDGTQVDFGTMTLKNDPEPDDPKERILFGGIAKVLDGQHRIEGLKDYLENHRGREVPPFELNVTIFVGIDVPDQAGIFATVNKTQTKVNRSLVFDLFALATTRSPERTCHEITVALDGKLDSPLYEKVKRLGVATDGRFGETLSQANVVDMLLKYMSRDPASDRDQLRRGHKLLLSNADELRKLIFRNMFIQEKDLEIAQIVWNFFEAVAKRWPIAWSAGGQGMMLNKTNGFRALMRFLRPAYLHLGRPGDVVSADAFYGLFEKVLLKDADFDVAKYKPGTGGETALYNDLVSQAGVSDELL